MIFAILFFCQHAIVFVYGGKYYIIGIFYFVTLDTYAEYNGWASPSNTVK